MFGYTVYFYFLPLVVPFVAYISPELAQMMEETKDF